MKIIGVIPARSGSKSVPNKNTKIFCGKPLIAWAILTALKSKQLDRVIVSTNDTTIADIAKQYGAEVPFLRPQELAGDIGGLEPTIKHAYQWLVDNENYKADGLALLPTTNPMRQLYHIDEAISIFKNKNCDTVAAVNETPANHTPFWTLIKQNNGQVCLFGGISLKEIHDRRQDFPHKCYARNDLIYVFKPKNLFESPPSFYGEKIELYETSPLYEIDINTLEDWELAEIRFKRLNQ